MPAADLSKPCPIDGALLDFDRGEAPSFSAAEEEASERYAYQARPADPLSDEESDRMVDAADAAAEYALGLL